MRFRGFLPVSLALLASLAVHAQAQPSTAPSQSKPRINQPPAPASVSGRVLRQDGTPLPKATVSLLPEARGAEAQAVRVDSNGGFQFAEIPPGRYRLAATRNGYVRQVYGQRGGGPGVTLDLQPGQRVPDVEIRLERAGVISGNVTDEDGEPVEGLPVYAQRVRFVAGGFLRVSTVRTDRTDDLGDFRLSGLAPGFYYVRAAGRQEGSIGIGGPPSAVSFAPSYFPGVPTREEAQKVQVRAGAEVPRIDLRVRNSPTFTISGIIVDAKAGSAASNYSVGFSSGGGTATRSVDRGDGSFELRGIEPGEYNLIGMVHEATGQSRSGYRHVVVTDSDVRVVIEIGRGAALGGKARMDDSDPFSFARIEVRLAADDENAVRPRGEIKEEGTFAVEEIPEGEYRIDIGTRASESYLKRATCGGQDYTNGKIKLVADQRVEGCEFLLARDTAMLNAFVTDGEKPAQGMVVVAIPQSTELRRSARNTVTAQADANGYVQLRGIIPGEYYVFALVPSEDAPYYDLEFPERNREAATTLTAKPKEQQALSLKVTEPK